MGYATTMYAIDLGKLRAAVGSKDSRLSQRIRRTQKLEDDWKSLAAGPRLMVNKNSDLILNRRQVSLEELRRELKRRCKGAFLYVYSAKNIRGAFGEPGALWKALALPPRHIRGLVGCSTEEQLFRDLEVEEFTEGQAVDELIAGEVTRPDCAFQYGYSFGHD